MGLGDAALATKIALFLILIGFIIHIIGFGAPYWTEGFAYNVGLWQTCNDITDSCTELDTDQFKNIGFDNWLQAVRTFECIGLIGSLAVIIFVCLYICVGSCSGSKCIAVLNIILCFATGGVIIVAIIIYAAERDSGLSWAFGLATAGGVCYLLAGILIIIAMRSY